MSAEAWRRTAHLKQEVFDVEHSVFTVDVFHYAFLFVLLVSADELEPHCVMSTLGRKEKMGFWEMMFSMCDMLFPKIAVIVLSLEASGLPEP